MFLKIGFVGECAGVLFPDENESKIRIGGE
jgi:hypothetical protein